ncbi:histone H1-like, partial [Cyprinus carpio]|uniref:Histone H1-like n=1 Tax=Cyprinus carpio TaxID=7962 RepID=A0A9Q9XZ46_CYPCA
ILYTERDGRNRPSHLTPAPYQSAKEESLLKPKKAGPAVGDLIVTKPCPHRRRGGGVSLAALKKALRCRRLRRNRCLPAPSRSNKQQTETKKKPAKKKAAPKAKKPAAKKPTAARTPKSAAAKQTDAKEIPKRPRTPAAAAR